MRTSHPLAPFARSSPVPAATIWFSRRPRSSRGPRPSLGFVSRETEPLSQLRFSRHTFHASPLELLLTFFSRSSPTEKVRESRTPSPVENDSWSEFRSADLTSYSFVYHHHRFLITPLKPRLRLRLLRKRSPVSGLVLVGSFHLLDLGPSTTSSQNTFSTRLLH